MRDTLMARNPEESLNREEDKESTSATRKLNAFIEKVREDIEKKSIGEADGQRLIAKATLLLGILTNM